MTPFIVASLSFIVLVAALIVGVLVMSIKDKAKYDALNESFDRELGK
jgi:hypothetical protein